MPLAEYMVLCLTHPEHGYYTTGHPVGGRGSANQTAGDFITSPEISQMFGELIGLCLAQSWLSHGAPSQFTLAELGPGRGTLMADALRALDAAVQYTELPGTGHNSWDAAYGSPALTDWLFEQRRR